jgi:hypothetical protein
MAVSLEPVLVGEEDKADEGGAMAGFRLKV